MQDLSRCGYQTFSEKSLGHQWLLLTNKRGCQYFIEKWKTLYFSTFGWEIEWFPVWVHFVKCLSEKEGVVQLAQTAPWINKKGVEYYPWVASSKQKMQESRRSPAKCSAWQHASFPGGPTNLLSPLMSCVLTKSRKLPSPGTGDEVFFLSSW